jgi:hypothetical protein
MQAQESQEFGGYDGGVEIGFEGTWDAEKFTALKETLQSAKDRAGESNTSELIPLGSYIVSVAASGANAGLHYRFKFSLCGITLFIHHNPPKGRQGIRVRYGAVALIGRSLFDVHSVVLRLLSDLGFTVTKETISRIDMQITVGISISDLMSPIFADQAVTKVRNDTFYRKGGICRTFLIGQRGRLQLCIYDKSLELRTMAVSNPAKFQLMVDQHLGEHYTFDQPLTRIEFRLWRDVLRLFEINTVEDLRESETNIVHFLTTKWFRILKDPKIRGHENTAAIHPLWSHIQECFCLFFPGLGREIEEITLVRDKPVTCEPVALQKQALGCLKTAIALSSGIQTSMDTLYAIACEWLGGVKQELFAGVNERAHKLRVTDGISITSAIERKRQVVDTWISNLQKERRLCYG